MPKPLFFGGGGMFPKFWGSDNFAIIINDEKKKVLQKNERFC